MSLKKGGVVGRVVEATSRWHFGAPSRPREMCPMLYAVGRSYGS